MKKSLLIIAVALGLLVTSDTKAQSTDSLLLQTYNGMDTAKTYPQFLMASNQFKLIAKQAPNDWVANYYAAWSIAIVSFREQDNKKKDPMLDEADAFFAKIELMDSTNDEIAVLGAMLANARISVAPQQRHKKYGDIANEYYAQAKKVNPNNPRMYYLQGTSLYYTPKLFGGGPDKALPLLQKADTLFANDSKDIRKPHWGKAVDEQMIKDCTEKK